MPTTFLNLTHHILAYDASEKGANDNPQRRLAHYVREFKNQSIKNVLSNQVVVPPSGSVSIYSGVQATSIAADTAFDVTLLSGSADAYRFRRSAGTQPALRAERSFLADATSEVTVTVNNNATATFASTGGTVLSMGAVAVGDVLRVSGVPTGDAAGPFNALNAGYWVVAAKTANSVACVRPDGASFSAAAEGPIVLGAGFASSFRIYSAAGVQVGYQVDITAGFSPVTRRTLTVSAVAPDFFEVSSPVALPLEAGVVPGAAGVTFYASAKHVVYIETDQAASIRLNGDTSDRCLMAPFLPGDPNQVAVFHKLGMTYSVTAVNRSASDPMSVYWFLAELA